MLKNLIAPKTVNEVTFSEIEKVITVHFMPTRNIVAERFKFYKRNQSAGETLSEYIVELKTMATTCEFKLFLNEALRDRFVCGLRESRFQTRLLNEKELDFEKACSIALSLEMTEEQMKIIKPESADIQYMSANRDRRDYKRDWNTRLGPRMNRGSASGYTRNYTSRDSKFQVNNQKSFKCYKCNADGHYAWQCIYSAHIETRDIV